MSALEQERGRAVLVMVWQDAGFEAGLLQPVLDALDRGSKGELRVAGERLLAEYVQPALDGVLREARWVIGTRGERDQALVELEEERFGFVQCYSSLRHVGAIADIPARDPERTVWTVAGRRATR